MGPGGWANAPEGGTGVLARLPTAMLLLSAPKPHVGQERNLKRAGVARDGAKGQMHQHHTGVKSQAENRFHKSCGR